ncbi:hypothetical protein B0A66_18710 [Flavobacterium hercynium]|uniref:DUF4280 domain-containing protein n=2 Tax=Flavobacterium hercynium TaxID=387094 RepID=A0A226GWR2_9FLAO|nr:hypothetical protein B0A66_18710 [Flavobacterium hercynium]
MPDYDKMLQERLQKEKKEKDEIFDMSQNVTQINERLSEDSISYKISEDSKENKKEEEEREEEEKAADELKLVIDGAKLQCSMCTNPTGDLKVNFKTPTIQGKKTATVKEKSMTSIMFKGNCTKSPQSASPCAAVMQLGEWKDVGTVKVQDQFPLLLKSTIKCNFGGSDIKITDCGQINEPTKIEALPKKVGKVISMHWTYDDTKLGSKSRFYVDMNLVVKTKDYQEGESIVVCIKTEDGQPLTDDLAELSLTGTVGKDDTVIFEKVFKDYTLNLQPKDDSE